jgi:ribosomal protein L11 methyltransferase
VTVPAERAEQARAVMLAIFPNGFEEVDDDRGVELAAYTNASGEERMWQAFGGAVGSDVPDDWENRWRSFHKPVTVAGLWIGPPWERPPEGMPTVVIDPGLAFGTGAHPTTRLCVELLAGLELRGSLLDVGCGSGVLSIAAGRLGFGPLIAVDLDPVAIDVSRENAAANGVELDATVVDATNGPLPATDVLVANIAPEPVAALSGRVRCRAAVTSGYLASDEPTLEGYVRTERVQSDGWAADLHLPK